MERYTYNKELIEKEIQKFNREEVIKDYEKLILN